MAAPALTTAFQPYIYQSPQGAVTPFQIFGAEAQAVQIMVKPGEKVQAKLGDVCYMSSSMQAEAPAEIGGGGGIIQWLAGRPDTTTTTFTNVGTEDGYIALGAPVLARILPIDLAVFGGEIICQREALLGSVNDVAVKPLTPRRARGAIVGVEGLLTQKLVGQGLAFVTAGGSVLQKKLSGGEVIVVDVGCLVAMTSTVACEVKLNGAGRRTYFGSDGPLQAHLTGPGMVFIQSLPSQRLAQKIARIVGAPNFRDNPRLYIFCLFFFFVAYATVITSFIFSET